MKGILILAHGSKRVQTQKILDSLTKKVISKSKINLVESAYLQFSEKDLKKGIECLLEKGATNIKVMPMFLFDGIHVTQDIPNELEEIKGQYPNVEINLTDHIGDDDRIADIIIDRVGK